MWETKTCYDSILESTGCKIPDEYAKITIPMPESSRTGDTGRRAKSCDPKHDLRGGEPICN
jgi:hypothetical protein